MKAAWMSVICCVLAILAAANSAALAFDPVDELLGVESTTSQDDSAFQALLNDDQAREQESASASRVVTDGSEWHSPAPPHIKAPAELRHLAPQAHESKPATGETVSAVPEPSAILLAVAALVYFLVFGRRRRFV